MDEAPLVAIAPDVWRAEAPPLRMAGGVYMPVAATVVRLVDRSLAIYSPVAFSPPQLAAIDALGEVAHVLAPNLLHHLAVAPALARWPRATFHAPAGLAAKRPDLPRARPLEDARERAFDGALELAPIAGAPKLAETVAFDPRSGTLACADLVFHVTRPHNLRTRALLAMMGVGGRNLMQSRLWRLLVRDRPATRAALARVLAWPIARVAPSHGAVATITAAALAPRLRRAYGGAPPVALQAGTNAAPAASNGHGG